MIRGESEIWTWNYSKVTEPLLTSCSGTTCHARRESFCPNNCNIFSVLSVFKYNAGKTNNKFVKLLLNNFYSVISYRRVRKESDKLLYTVLVTRYGPQVVNLLRCNDVSRTSRIFFFQNHDVCSVLSIFEVKQNRQNIINLLLLCKINFNPVISYRRVENVSDELLHYGSQLMLQKWLKRITNTQQTYNVTLR